MPQDDICSLRGRARFSRSHVRAAGEHGRVDRRWLEKALKPVILDWTKR